MAEVRKLTHQTGADTAREVVTVTVTDVELTRKVMVYGHLIEMSGTVPVINVEHVGNPGQQLDEAKVAKQVEAKVRKYPDEPGRWTL